MVTTIFDHSENHGTESYQFVENIKVIVNAGVVIQSNFNANQPYAAIIITDTASMDVSGTVASNYTGVETGGLAEDHPRLTVESTGLVYGFTYGVNDLSGGAPVIVNHGEIIGDRIGIHVTKGALTIINTGLIAGNSIDAISTVNDGVNKISNSGTIDGSDGYGVAYYASGQSVDIVTNRGTMLGDIILGAGDDVFDTRLGHVQNGDIDAGSGNDKITGSAFADTIAGGSGRDTFFFKTKADAHAVDHITDFRHGQDHLSLSKSLFKLDSGQSVASAFQDITAGLSHEGEDKHILYNHNNGYLYYDADGKGGHGPIHFATLDTHPVISSADILMA